MYQAKIILDSVSPMGVRLVTVEVTYPLIVHNEVCTHRANSKSDSEQFDTWLEFSRSSSSNRALAPTKIREEVLKNPFVPDFRRRSKGMVPSDEPLSEKDLEEARFWWLSARNYALMCFEQFDNIPVHKQWRNRLLSPFQWITTVMTANDEMWQHWFDLRNHKDAQDEFQIIARMVQDEYKNSRPETRTEHTPYISWMEANQLDIDTRRQISVARCARTSYLRQGEMFSINEDLELYERLWRSQIDPNTKPHAAPYEHVAFASDDPMTRSGNYRGWYQLRKVLGM